MADYIYVDNSNLYIEGRRVAAVKNGLAANMHEAMNLGIFDHGYTISFGKLYDFLAGQDLSSLKRAALFGSRPPPNDSIWQIAKRVGFELHLEDRNVKNKEKKIDTGIATLITKDAYKHGVAKDDTFVLVAGDADYVPTILALKEDGYKVEVVFWSHAARELREVASKFIPLDDYFDALRF